MENKEFIVGDIHGAYRALMQVLERANFNSETDTLYAVGDYCDGWTQSFEVLEYLRNLKHFKGVLGNHDMFLMDYLEYGTQPSIWLRQGGEATFNSYAQHKYELREEHLKFLKSMPYYIEKDNILICHGGIDLDTPIRDQYPEDILWDRELITNFVYDYCMGIARDSIDPYEKIIIGHTQMSALERMVTAWEYPKNDNKPLDLSLPFMYNGLYNLDTGAGWSGKLTVMDLHTDEYWQSDEVNDLYPEEKGRG